MKCVIHNLLILILFLLINQVSYIENNNEIFSAQVYFLFEIMNLSVRSTIFRIIFFLVRASFFCCKKKTNQFFYLYIHIFKY